MQPSAAIAPESGILRHLEAQVLPATEGGRDLRTGARGALPVEFRAQSSLQHGLLNPLEVDGAF